MKARIHITLKEGVLDPQGAAIKHSLGAIGFEGVDNVRQGKVVEMDVQASSTHDAHTQITVMCEKLLANTVIENYAIEIE
jgi:phosphoribosylformylglycinamidine synthase PurS subunit